MAPRHPTERALGGDMHGIRLHRPEALGHAAEARKRQPDLGIGRAGDGVKLVRRQHRHLDAEGGEFEKSLSDQARRNHVDGVICGHIHHAASRDIEGIHYLNTGDWVESCTAIGERADGTFEMIRWHEVVAERKAQTAAQLAEALQVA